MIEPIRRQNDAVEILDQRALPEDLRYLSCTRADDVIAAIQSLAVRGAPAIGVAGVYGLWLEARALTGHPDFMRRLREAKDRLQNARPTAVNLSWALDRTWYAVRNGEPTEVARMVQRAGDMLAEEERQRSARMAEAGAALIAPNTRVLTHCNTGSLATVGVGTALGVIREAYHQGKVDSVWVDETRPLLQGARLTAWELEQDNIPATLITDSMAAMLMAKGLVDAVVVGADRICANGDTANKIGTYSLAVLAHHHQVPFYVVAPMSTVDPHLDEGSAIPIEERAGDEVRTVRGTPVAPEAMRTYNPAFDVTPGTLITAIVTDRGVARVPYRLSLEELLAREAARPENEEGDAL